jgi:hypothetical protein
MLQRINNAHIIDPVATTADLPAATPSALAAAVPRSREHEALVARIEQMSAEREAVIAEMRSLIAGNSGEQNDPQIRRLQKRRLALEESLTEARIACQPLRGRHAEHIREALDPTMRSDAFALLRSLAEVSRVAARLNECVALVEQAAGGPPSPERFRQDFGMMEFMARRIAGLLEDGT